MDLINKKSVAINKGKNNMLGSQFFNWFHHLHMGQLVIKKKKYLCTIRWHSQACEIKYWFECVCKNFQIEKANVVY